MKLAPLLFLLQVPLWSWFPCFTTTIISSINFYVLLEVIIIFALTVFFFPRTSTILHGGIFWILAIHGALAVPSSLLLSDTLCCSGKYDFLNLFEDVHGMLKSIAVEQGKSCLYREGVKHTWWRRRGNIERVLFSLFLLLPAWAKIYGFFLFVILSGHLLRSCRNFTRRFKLKSGVIGLVLRVLPMPPTTKCFKYLFFFLGQFAIPVVRFVSISTAPLFAVLVVWLFFSAITGCSRVCSFVFSTNWTLKMLLYGSLFF